MALFIPSQTKIHTALTMRWIVSWCMCACIVDVNVWVCCVCGVFACMHAWCICLCVCVPCVRVYVCVCECVLCVWRTHVRVVKKTAQIDVDITYTLTAIASAWLVLSGRTASQKYQQYQQIKIHIQRWMSSRPWNRWYTRQWQFSRMGTLERDPS